MVVILNNKWEKWIYLHQISVTNKIHLMTTKTEIKEEKTKLNEQKIETSATEPMPSIWYN